MNIRDIAISEWNKLDREIQDRIHSPEGSTNFLTLLETDDYIVNWFMLEVLENTRYLDEPVLQEVVRQETASGVTVIYKLSDRFVSYFFEWGTDYPNHLNDWKFVEKRVLMTPVETWVEIN